jgi:predicted methyltransferase
MGTNYIEYFKEAYRLLKPMGLVLIAEPQSRWEDREDDLKEKLESVGFRVNGEIRHSDRFIYVDAIKY